ncbi:polyketide synthase [Streptomyces sp. ME19-01-6]|uniref:polyketide synthase n=1 Tax=Streptomyces sp. ME19-01-6 TaxID=3028686 RepID=UPI0029BCFC63|nr:polyketide synthase [Streptomyces sp. ME19-01-6]MDX3228003.1 beta-ketoacyl synthase N-terminal-like domain-containing protein [Streptomyces sp. ME19-01-6]
MTVAYDEGGGRRPPVAIVGMAVLLPGAPDLGTYWRNLAAGVDAITEVPAQRWDAEFYAPGSGRGPATAADRVYCRRGGFVDGLAEVEVTRFGIMPASVPGTEPDQLIALHVAAAAVADAGGEERLPDRGRVGVVLGRGGYLTPGLVRLDQRVRTAHQLVRTLGELLPGLGADELERVRTAFTERLGPDRPEAAIGLVPNLAASRVANRLDLRGPAYTVDAACASSLVAVDQAVGELASGRCDAVLAGGVHHCHDITLWSVFAQLRALSPSERIRPFHREADGILIGEGTGVVVLKRLADARRDGDRVYAVIRGTGVAGDGRAAGLVTPDPGGQTRAVRQAWRAAGLDPREPGTLGLLEAHGTATPAGDTAELATLAEAFGPATGDGPGHAVIGSVKSMIGHTMPAAGVAGLVKAALAIHHSLLPPTLHCDDPHPALAATRFRPIATAEPWETGRGAGVRRAAVNAFGFGGINAHVVLEQPPSGPARPPTPPRRRTPAAATALATGPGVDTPDAVGPAPRTGAARSGPVAETPHTTAAATRMAAPEPTATPGAASDTPDDSTAPPQPAAATHGATATGTPVPSAAPGGVVPAVSTTPQAQVTEPERVLALGAETPEGLAGLLAADDATVRTTASAAGRVRLGVVGPTAKRLALARRVVAKGSSWRGRNDVWFTPAPLLSERAAGGPGRIVFVFPGLEAEFAPRVDGVAEYFGLSPATVGATDGRAPVGDIGRHGVGVFAVGRLLDGALRRMGVVPDAVAGHSVGEWTAMVSAGLYSGAAVDDFLGSFDPDALRVPGLAFGVLGAPAERVLAALAEGADGRVVLSHDNAPSQSMVCGPRADVDAFVRRLRGEGVIGHLLPFQSGFHTPMLAPYLGPIRAAAERFELFPPSVPLWSGTTAAPYPPDAAGVRELFVRHLLEPVRFRLLTKALYEAGFRAFVQVGPGQLASLIGDTLQGSEHLAVAADSPHRDGIAQLRRVATALWVDGARADPSLPRPAASPAVAAPSVTAPSAASPKPVRLDLGGALISLDERHLAELRGVLASGGATAQPTALRADALFALDAVAGRFPAAAELGALLRETAGAATELIAVAGRAGGPPAPPLPQPAPSATTPPPTAWRTVLRVSTDTMPYLRDHCFFRQRPGWPDESDRWPVVPATTIVGHLMDAAERAAAGRRAIAVHGARFGRWVTAAPPAEVPITVAPSPDGPDRLAVDFGRSAQGTVELAPRHPHTRPAPWPADPATEEAPAHTAVELYDRRWMFHGPAFQGVSEITAIGAARVRGTITTPTAPGALLDNVGQLLGYWLMATRTERTVVFPVGMRHIRLFGPQPLPGTPVECVIRVVSLTDTTLEADVQLRVGGQVWAQIDGWQDRRFDNHPSTRPVERFPELNALSQPRPGGWVLLHERWPDLASRDLIMRNHLGGAERMAYERRAPRGRRQWLLGRIAAKDAVRQWLWARGEGPVFPAEIQVCEDARGRPYVLGVHGRTLPALDLSLASRAEAGVALVVPRPPGRERPGPGPGIHIEETTGHGTAGHSAAGQETAALRAAKEAVAKAEGTGGGGDGPDITVLDAEDPERLLLEVVTAAGRPRRYRVRSVRTASPPGLPSRDYVVAWTTGPADDK